MTAGAKIVFHVEGDQSDMLFTLDTLDVLKHQLRENDTFHYTGPAGNEHYKVESVDYHLSQISGSPGNPGSKWDEPVIYYGVTVVP